MNTLLAEGNPLRLFAMNIKGSSVINTNGKTYFGWDTGDDCQFDAPANFFAQPRYVQIQAAGIYSTPVVNTATLNFGFDIIQNGVTTVVASVGSWTPLGGLTSRGWMFNETIVCQGGSKLTTPGTAQPAGYLGFATGGLLGSASFANLVNTTTLNMNTTQPMSIKLWAQWNSILPGCSITLQTFAFMASD